MTTVDGRPAAVRLDGAVFKVAGVVVLGAIMSILDVTVVTVALPTFQTVFGASYATVAWTMTGYTLALAAVIPLTGWAADRFGTKRLYLLALGLFVAGSALCSTAWSIESLIAFRVLQGLGGGMLAPLGMTIMTRAAGPARVGRVMSVLGVPMLLGPISWPILGGWLIESMTWQWIFLINVPLGVVALVAATVVLPTDSPAPRQLFDVVGLLLMSPGLALLLFGVSSVAEVGTVLAARVLVPAVVGATLLGAFVRHACRPEHPLVDLRLFGNRQFTIAVITSVLFGIAFVGTMLLIPSYLLQVRGESALTAGLLMAPQALGAMVTMPIAGRLADATRPGLVVLAGLIVVAVGVAGLTRVTADTPYPMVLGALFVMGLGMGGAMMPNMTAAVQTLRDHMIARGSTLLNIVQQVASAAGTAIMAVLLTSRLAESPLAGAAIAARSDPAVAATLPGPTFARGLSDAASAFAGTFGVALVLVLITLVPALLLARQRPAAPVGADPATLVLMH